MCLLKLDHAINLTIYEACKMAVFIPSLYQMHDLFLPLFSLYIAWFLLFLRHTDGFACRKNEFPLLTKIYILALFLAKLYSKCGIKSLVQNKSTGVNSLKLTIKDGYSKGRGQISNKAGGGEGCCTKIRPTNY